MKKSFLVTTSILSVIIVCLVMLCVGLYQKTKPEELYGSDAIKHKLLSMMGGTLSQIQEEIPASYTYGDLMLGPDGELMVQPGSENQDVLWVRFTIDKLDQNIFVNVDCYFNLDETRDLNTAILNKVEVFVSNHNS